MIYLDSAATSLLKPPEVYTAVNSAMRSMASPGRGAHRAAMLAADKVYECRELAASLFGFDDPEGVVFTLNATHALNIAIRSIVKAGDRVLISGYEHNSVTRVLNDIGAEVTVCAAELFDARGVYKAFEREIARADAVICNHVSNVFGFIQPVNEIAELCRLYKVPFILDASQSAGASGLDCKKLNAAYIAMPGHKGLMGPQGTGILLCSSEAKPFMCGGTGSDSFLQDMPDYLPDRLEAGTHNVPGIAGLAEGIKYILKAGADNIGAYEAELCSVMADRLRQIDGLEVFYGSRETQAGVLSFRHSSLDPETVCAGLGRAGIAARCGMHCSPLAHNTAGTADTGTVRFSFSPLISRKQVMTAASVLERQLRSGVF